MPNPTTIPMTNKRKRNTTLSPRFHGQGKTAVWAYKTQQQSIQSVHGLGSSVGNEKPGVVLPRRTMEDIANAKNKRFMISLPTSHNF